MNNKAKNRILNTINSPEDIKYLNNTELEVLAEELRVFLIEKVSKTGGHLASNLGVVELTLAIHRIFKTDKDRLVWDVGHQSYVHKIVTGRKDAFDTLRKTDGISGFPKVKESIHDAFNTGHSSTSISAALGFSKARTIKGEDHSVIAVIGDGALTGGMAFEALNDAGRSPDDLIVVLNDNEMSISKNVGGLSTYLSKIRTGPFYYKVKEDIDNILSRVPSIKESAMKAIGAVKGSIKYLAIPGIIFEELGFKYLGPIDGHNIEELQDVLQRAKDARGPVLIHVCTQKGKGYHYAENMPHLYHGISPFEIETGEVLSKSGKGYSSVFGDEIVKIAKENTDVVAITAAMPHGTGLDKFSKMFKSRFFDVGIAEQHAVTFAAGLARGGLKPVIALYSSFLQRAYDQVIHDVATQNLSVVFAIDRAGLVGQDGETHQGLYDYSYLSHIPNMTIMAPSDYTELTSMLNYAVNEHEGPIAIRYPRGKGHEELCKPSDIVLGKGVNVKDGKDIVIVAIGNMVETGLKTAKLLEESGIIAQVINARFVKPLDEKLILSAVNNKKMVVTIEDNTVIGGLGSCINDLLAKNDKKIKTRVFAYSDCFVEHGTCNDLMERYCMTPELISNSILNDLGLEKNLNLVI